MKTGTAKTGSGLRLMIYDRSCAGRGLMPGLADAWWSGGHLYRALGRLDACRGVASWDEALQWLARYQSQRPIDEIQFWGHGQWGGLWIDEELLTIEALQAGHRWRERLDAVRARMQPDASSLWWFRSCDTFGTIKGHHFARAWSRFFASRVAGHTYTIQFWQSGLHVLEAGAEPHWSVAEGVLPGHSHAKVSHPLAPNTISCLQGRPISRR